MNEAEKYIPAFISVAQQNSGHRSICPLIAFSVILPCFEVSFSRLERTLMEFEEDIHLASGKLEGWGIRTKPIWGVFLLPAELE